MGLLYIHSPHLNIIFSFSFFFSFFLHWMCAILCNSHIHKCALFRYSCDLWKKHHCFCLNTKKIRHQMFYNTNILFVQHKLWKFEAYLQRKQCENFSSCTMDRRRKKNVQHTITDYLMTSNSFVVVFFLLFCLHANLGVYFSTIINHKLSSKKYISNEKEENCSVVFCLFITAWISFANF